MIKMMRGRSYPKKFKNLQKSKTSEMTFDGVMAVAIKQFKVTSNVFLSYSYMQLC